MAKKPLKIFYLLLLNFIVVYNTANASCSGRFVNPITDICWSCIFPLTIGPVPVNVGGREDYKPDNTSSPICVCPRAGVPVPGIPVGFWEPVRLVDVVREPYCMVNMGGVKMGGGYKKHGSVAAKASSQRGGLKNSFYHVHWYVYPLIAWLEILVDFACMESGSFDLAYVTELDPMWNNDELSFIINPEAAIFGNPLAQAACSGDCMKASVHFPANQLFWCAGCQGSLYPFTGSVSTHAGGVQASQLLTQRMMAKLHREFLLWQTSGSDALCAKKPAPIIKKTQYKIQMTYPIPTATGPHACNPIGRTEVIQGSGKEFLYKGEDFGYLIWRKVNCCAF